MASPKTKKRRQAPAAPAPVIPSITSLPLDPSQTTKALSAVLAHTTSLLDKAREGDGADLLAGGEGSNEDTLSLVVTLKRASPREKHKPILIPLPNALLDPRESPVCLFVKDPQREYKDLLADNKITFISKVVGITKLRGKHAPYEARRLLQKSHSLFLADARILPLLAPLLGNAFINTKSLPVPVNLDSPSSSLKAELERAIGGTSLRLPSGTCLNVKIGSVSRHSVDQLKENLETVATHLAAKLPLGGWENVQALHVKSGTSASLPIWNCTLEAGAQGGRFSELPEQDKVKKDKAVERKEKAKVAKTERKEKKKARQTAAVEATATSVGKRKAEDVVAEAEKSPSTKKAKKDASDPAPVPAAVPATELSLVDGAPVTVKPKKEKKPKAAPLAVVAAPAPVAAVSTEPEALPVKEKKVKKAKVVEEVTSGTEKGNKKKEKEERKKVSSMGKKVKGPSKVKA